MCELCDVEVEDTAPLDTILRRLSKAMIQRMKSNQKSDLKVMSRPEGIEEMQGEPKNESGTESNQALQRRPEGVEEIQV